MPKSLFFTCLLKPTRQAPSLKRLHTLFLNEHSATLLFSAASTLFSSQQRGMGSSRSGSCLTPLQSAVTGFSTSKPFAICSYRKGGGGYIVPKNVPPYRRSPFSQLTSATSFTSSSFAILIALSNSTYR